MQKCTLALGCFWKPEENFRNKPGIIETEVGYAGGKKQNITYEEVCVGNTGHAEVVKLSFDEKIISFNKILDLFKVNGLIKVEKIMWKKSIPIDVIKKRFTSCNFFTPEVHNIINSFSWICLMIKIIRDIKKDNGMNFVKILKKFKIEYIKYVFTE